MSYCNKCNSYICTCHTRADKKINKDNKPCLACGGRGWLPPPPRERYNPLATGVKCHACNSNLS